MFEIAPNVSFWTIVNFILLLIVLRIFAWKPVLAIIERREKKIRDALEQADKAQKEAEKKLEEHKNLFEKGRIESAEMIAQAKEKANKIQNEILEKANSEALLLIKKAKDEISLEREKALKEIKSKVADISVAIAEKMIRKSITVDDHRELISSSIKELDEVK